MLIAFYETVETSGLNYRYWQIVKYSDSFRVQDAVYWDVERIQRVFDDAVHRKTLAAAGRFNKNQRSMETADLAQLESANCSRCKRQCPN